MYTHRSWLGFVGALGVCVTFAVQGVRWALAPESRTAAFGAELADGELAFAYDVAIANLLAALLLAIFLARRDRIAVALVLAAAFVLPAGNLIAQLRAGFGVTDLHVFDLVLASVILASLVLTLLAADGSSRTRDPLAGSGSTLKRTLIILAVALPVLASLVVLPGYFITPEATAEGRDISLNGDQMVYAHVRGFKELFTMLVNALFLLRWRRAELMIYYALGILEIGGTIIGELVTGVALAHNLPAYAVYAAWLGGLLFLLHAQRATSETAAGRPEMQPAG